MFECNHTCQVATEENVLSAFAATLPATLRKHTYMLEFLHVKMLAYNHICNTLMLSL